MKVSRIQIRNILGIEELEIAPGAITVLEGKNGVGKTSTIEAIRTVIEGGHDATLVRSGAEAGEVVLVLEDETEIRKRITARGSSVTVKRPDVGEIKAPQTYIGKLTDVLSVNPVAFLTADPRRQAEYLLEALPLELDRDALSEAIGSTVRVVDAECTGHPLDVLARIRQRAYNERTGVNRAAKEKRATVEQLSASLPAESEGRAASVPELRDRLTAAQRDRDLRLQRLKEERDRDIAGIQERARQEIEAIKAKAEEAVENVRRGAENLLALVAEQAAPGLDQHAANLAEAEAAEKEAARHRNTRAVLDTLTAEAAELESQAADLTAALDRLDALKVSLLRKLPIKGVEVVDGVIEKDGVPFHRLNRAEQVKVAIGIARLRAGEIPLICVDGLECLDGKTFDLFCERARETDLQFVVTRVIADAEDPREGLLVTAGAA